EFFHDHGSSVGLYDTRDLEIMKQYAVVEVDPVTGRVVDFVEKPSDPRSTLAATCIYLWKGDHLPLVHEYGASGRNMDAPAHYVQWLRGQVDVYGFSIPGDWRDIGNPEQYEAACREYGATSAA